MKAVAAYAIGERIGQFEVVALVRVGTGRNERPGVRMRCILCSAERDTGIADMRRRASNLRCFSCFGAPVGTRFGRLVVLEHGYRAPSGKQGPDLAVLARCDCGVEKVVNLNNMRAGNTVACGDPSHRTDGRTKHPLYSTWLSMVQRCTNPNRESYPDYGGRGITVAPEFLDAGGFIAYCDEVLGSRPDRFTLDRIDNERGYEPGNLRWASRSVQRTNRRAS